MDPDQRLPEFCRFPDKCLLTGWKIDITCVYAFPHGRHRAGSMFSPNGQDDHICFFYCQKRLLKAGFVCTGNGITVCIPDFCFRHPAPHLFQQASAFRFLAVQYCIKLFRLVRLDIGSRNCFDLVRIRLNYAAHSGNGIGNRISGFHHAHMGITAKKFPCTIGMRPDQGNFLLIPL